MSFLAVSLLTIISTGGAAFQKTLDEKNAGSEARIAISYITVKLRQNSARARVSIVPSDSATNARNVIKIDVGVPGEFYYIYFEEPADGGPGRLVEKKSYAPRVDDSKGAVKIADISDFEVAYADETRTSIVVSVSGGAPSERVARGVAISLRS